MKVVIFLSFLVMMALLLFNQKEWVGYIKAGEWSTLKKMMGEDLGSVMLITLGFMFIQNLFSFVPFLLLTMFNIWLFGFIYGYFWSLIGNILGSLLVFYLARYSLYSWLQKQKYSHAGILKKIEENGFSTILIARMLPIIPSSIINIVSGVSNVKQKDFILSTFVGHALFVLILSTFSLGLISLDQQYLVYFLLIIMILSVVGLKIRIKIRNDREEERELLRRSM
ncbi:TVP38/TMEM64 family protein [Anaerobacillus alkalidiazotrophicus]|uniref:TVP38/TMEM64 family membrane protein n=1 Tax=Anaerobacillus alkalidiazotrophicus TaxID=472963 RepID=A0A1S2M2E6_9BACI|nr:VTT domain-containing protein [Anaerobacillus alkalidiazotrophicus]OIJ18690.1 TVP38/TMEM64 family protein [Anaerobacillus alkalidiazotrophicus]